MATLAETIDTLDYVLAHADNTPEIQELIGLIDGYVTQLEESGTLVRDECFIF